MSNAAQEVAKNQLRTSVERIERLADETKTIGGDMSGVHPETKGSGA